MRIFLSILGWFFGIIFLIGSIPYFWCGEYILGLWSFVVVTVLIPQLYKFVSDRLNFKFSKPQALAVSLVIFVLLFANFIRPLFYTTKEEKKCGNKMAECISNAFKPLDIIPDIEKIDTREIKCKKWILKYKVLSVSMNDFNKCRTDYIQEKDAPNIFKLGFLTFLPIAKNVEKSELNKIRKIINQKCGDF